MENKPAPVTFQMAFAFDRYDSLVPMRMVEKLKSHFTKPIKITCPELYPRRLLFSGVPVEFVPSVYATTLTLLDGWVGEAKGISIVQESGGIE
ncbi:MAG: hypothetical protein RL536_144 [Candidatus Parcubacteria bacterium]|jgi:hypothetical protein